MTYILTHLVKVGHQAERVYTGYVHWIHSSQLSGAVHWAIAMCELQCWQA